MALTKAQIDLMYEGVLSRHATLAEQAEFSALSNFESTAQIELDIATLPEATSLADPLIRLYQGAFGRTPDAADPNGNFDTGAQSGYWVNQNALRNGVTLLGLAQAFVVSAEFTSLYGSAAVTPALITAFYQHILGRDPASAEVAAWQATGLDAAHILIGFTQSNEFIARSQASVDAFKVLLANGTPPAPGPLPPPPAQLTLEDDHNGTVNEGQTVTFTLQSTNAADFGKTFSYNITGSVSAADIVGGSLVGSVTLDAQGLAHVAVTLVADATTEGNETLTLNVGALTDTVTVVDTSKSPTILTFTSTSGETLNGTDGNDLFKGVVDHSAFNDVGTFQNVIDVANGGKGFDTLQLVVNQSNIDIVPNAPGVEELLVTDLTGANYNLSKMADLQVIASDGSTGGTMNFFNVQNIVNLDVENSDLGFQNLNVTVVDGAGTGAVDLNLVNSGSFNLNYHNSSGNSVVTDWAIHATGANNDLNDLHGAGITKTFTIDGSGSLRLDLDNGDDTSGVTSVDATGLAGDFTLVDLHANQVDIEGAVGDNDLSMHALGGANVTINTFAGDDTINVNNLNGTDNGQTFNIDTGAGDDQVNVTETNSDGDSFTIGLGSGNNGAALNIGASATVNVSALDGNNNVNVTVHGDPDGAATFSASNVTVKVGNGANNITVNTVADGNGSDQGSTIKITAGNGGNTINATADDAATISILSGTGFDQVNATVDDGAGSVDVNVGDGGSIVNVAGGTGSTLKVTGGAGTDTVFVNGGGAGGGGTASITVDTGADNDSIRLSWLNAANPVVNVKAGTGNDRVQLQDSTIITANAVLDGGDGIDTLALQSVATTTANILGKALNFETLEITDRLVNDVNLIDFLNAGSHITKVVLDDGSAGTHILSGADSGLTLDLHGAGGAGEVLTVLLNNANINVHDVLNLNLFNNASGNQNHGDVNLGPPGAGIGTPSGNIEQVNLGSFSDGSTVGDINQVSINGNSAIDLHITGGTSLVVTDNQWGAGFLNVSNVDAATFTGDLTGNFFHATNVAGTALAPLTFNAPLVGNTNIFFFDEVDHVTLGNGTNVVGLQGGDDDIHVGSGQNTITGGGGQDDITFAAHSATTVDTIVYQAASESGFSLPDIINGFNQATDHIDLPFAVEYFEASSDLGVQALMAAHAGGGATAVLNTSTGHLFIDANDNGTLTTAADMEINLVGVNHLQASTFV